jgi:hypothetical protein
MALKSGSAGQYRSYTIAHSTLVVISGDFSKKPKFCTWQRGTEDVQRFLSAREDRRRLRGVTEVHEHTGCRDSGDC